MFSWHIHAARGPALYPAVASWIHWVFCPCPLAHAALVLLKGSDAAPSRWFILCSVAGTGRGPLSSTNALCQLRLLRNSRVSVPGVVPECQSLGWGMPHSLPAATSFCDQKLFSEMLWDRARVRLTPSSPSAAPGPFPVRIQGLPAILQLYHPSTY